MTAPDAAVARMDDGIIEVGSDRADALGFTADKFEGYLWKEGDRVLISFIVSKQEGRGHLSALFGAIEQAGLRVAMPTPFPRMQRILERKGFQPRTEITEDDLPCEVWERPPALAADLLAGKR